MPARIEQAHPAPLRRAGLRIGQRAGRAERLLLHARLDRPALLVELIEARRQLPGAARVVGEQAADADAHVVEAAGGVQARRDGKARSAAESSGPARSAMA